MRLALLLLLAVTAGVIATGFGGATVGTPTYTGQTRAASATLAVVDKRPSLTAWALSITFTPAGAALRRRVERLSNFDPLTKATQLEAFCLSGRRLWWIGVGPSDVKHGSLRVPRFLDLPEPKRWVCGLHDSSSPKSLKAMLSTSLLVVTLTRQ